MSLVEPLVYDTRDELTGEMSAQAGNGVGGTSLYSNAFGYDLSFNPTSFKGSSLTQNSDNQFLSGDFGTNWQFDGNGSPTTYKSSSLTFDIENRLVSIASPAFAATYAPDDRRASKTANGTTTYYLYDEDGGASPLLEEQGSSVSMGYGMAGDGLRARYAPQSGGLYYLFQWDPQGSLVQRQTGGPGGNTSYYALDTAMFDGYGAKLSDTDAFTGGAEAARDAMGFQGQFGAYTDNETGLVLMGHRYYDAGTGRFLTRDPLGYGGGINLYGFTGNNPVNDIDPDGTQNIPSTPEPEKSDEGRDVAEDNPLQWIIDMNEMRKAQELRRSQGEAAASEFFSKMTAGNPFGDGKSVMSELEVALLRDKLTPKGIRIELGTPGAEARLPLMNRDAGEFNPAQRTIYLHSNPTRSAVYEEVYHAYQFLRDGRSNVARPAPGRSEVPISSHEYEAKTFLLRNRHRLGIPNSESRTTLQHLWRLHHGFDQN